MLRLASGLLIVPVVGRSGILGALTMVSGHAGRFDEARVREEIEKSEGRLRFLTDAKTGVDHGEVIFIAVGTPPDEDGSADLKYVLAVATSIGRPL